MVSFKSLIDACQNYVDQCEIDARDSFHRTKMDKIIDDIRDYMYIKAPDMKALYCKHTECETPDQYDRVVMTREHFLRFVKAVSGDKHSSREIEQVYRNLVSLKAMTYASFSKTFVHGPVEDQWLETGAKALKEYMLRRGLDVSGAFQRLISIAGEPRLTKYQWRDVMKREGLPFNYAQINFLFEAFDRHSRDKVIDEADWSFMFSSLIKDSKHILLIVSTLRQGRCTQTAP